MVIFRGTGFRSIFVVVAVAALLPLAQTVAGQPKLSWAPSNPSTRVTEDVVRTGAANFVIALSNGYAWVDPMDTATRSALVNGFNEYPISSRTAASFQARRSTLLPLYAFTISATNPQELGVQLSADAAFDTYTSLTLVNISVPAAAVVKMSDNSFVAPTNALSFRIFFTQGTVSLLNSNQFSEASIRAGGQVLTLLLTNNERWYNTTKLGYWATPNTITGWNAFSSTIIQASFAVVSGQTCTVTLQAAPLLDVATNETVVVSLPPGTVYGPIPSGTLTFLIAVSPGLFSISKPFVVNEDEIYRKGSRVVDVSLAIGETWNVTAITAALSRASLSALTNEPYGFNARKSVIVTKVTAISSSLLRLYLNVDPMYDIAQLEEVVFAPNGSFVASGVAPVVAVGSTVSDRFSVVPSPCWLKSIVITVSEKKIVQGTSFSFDIVRGETFASGQAALWHSIMVSAASAPTYWNARSGTLLPLTGIVTTGAPARRATFTTASGSGYDIAVPETVFISFTGGLFASSFNTANRTAYLNIYPSPDLLQAYSTLKPMTVSLTFTEAEMRHGAGSFVLNWTQGFETWKGQNFWASNVAALSGDLLWPFAWRSLNASIIRGRSSFTYFQSMRALAIRFFADSLYDTATTETIRVSVPNAAILSGLPSSDGHTYYDFTITPTQGAISLVCCQKFSELDVRAGRAVLTLRLAVGETLVAGHESLWKSAFSSSASLSTEPHGFAKNQDSLLASINFQITNNSRDLRIKLGPIDTYSLVVSSSETITVSFAALSQAFRSGIVPLPASLAFSITKAVPAVNLTVSEPLNERALRRGGWRLRFTLAAYDSWISSATSVLLDNIVGSSVARSGFNGQRGAILQSRYTIIPPAQFAYGASVVGQAAPAYEVNQTETVVASLPAALFTSGMSAGPLTFLISPSRAYLFADVNQLSEDALRTGWDSVKRRPTRLRLFLEDIERWNTTIQKPVALIVTAPSHAGASPPSNFDRVRTALMKSVAYSLVGQVLIINFTAIPSFEIDHPFNITFVVLASAVESGLAPFTNEWGLGRLTVNVVPSKPTLHAANITVSEKALISGGVAAKFSIVGGRFVSSHRDRVRCQIALLNNVTLRSTNPQELALIKAHLSSLLTSNSFAFEGSNQTMVIRLNSLSALNTLRPDLTTDLQFLFSIPRLCIQGKDLVSPVTLRITFVPDRIPSIRIVPSFLTEADIRSRKNTVRIVLTSMEKWGPPAVGILQRALRPDDAKTAAGLALLAGVTAAVRVKEQTYGLRGRWWKLAPRVAMEGATTLSVTLQKDPLFDVNVDAQILLFGNANLTKMMNGTRFASNIGRLTILLGTLALPIKVSQANVVLWPKKFMLLEYNIRYASPALRTTFWRNISLTLTYGEEWINTTAAQSAIYSSLVSTTVAGRSAILATILSPVKQWRLESHPPPFAVTAPGLFNGIPGGNIPKVKNTWVIPITLPYAGFDINADELLKFNIPASSVISQVAPNSNNATVMFIAEKLSKFVVRPGTLLESTLHRTNVIVEVVLGSRKYRYNDSWIAANVNSATVRLLNASRVITSSATSFGRRLAARVTLSVNGRILQMTVPRDVLLDVRTPEKVVVDVAPSCLRSGNAPPTGSLYFTILPVAATVRVSGTATMRGNTVILQTTRIPETYFAMGKVVFNLTFASTDGETFNTDPVKLADIRNQVRRAFSSTFDIFASQVRIGASLLTSSIVLTAHSLLLTFSPNVGVDVDRTESVTLKLFPSLFASNKIPSITGWGIPLVGSSLNFTVAPWPGSIASVSFAPLTVTETVLRTTGVDMRISLAPGETFAALSQQFYSAFLNQISTLQGASQSYFGSITKITRLIALKNIRIDASRRVVTIHMNDTQFSTDDATTVQFSLSKWMFSSRLVPRRSIFWMNITADPAIVTLTPRIVVASSVSAGARQILALSLVGDTWAQDAASFITLQGSQPAASGVDASGRPYNNFNTRARRIFSSKNITRMTPNLLMLSLGPDSEFNPNVEEVVTVNIAKYATKRRQDVQNPQQTFNIVLPSLQFDVITRSGVVLPRGSSVSDASIRAGGMTLRFTVRNNKFVTACRSSILVQGRRIGGAANSGVSVSNVLTEVMPFLVTSSSTTLFLNDTTILMNLRPTTRYQPCAAKEHITINLNSRCFLGPYYVVPPADLAIVVANATLSSITAAFPSWVQLLANLSTGSAAIQEPTFRRFGLVVNLTVSRGSWDISALMVVINKTVSGSLDCSTCFQSRKKQILPSPQLAAAKVRTSPHSLEFSGPTPRSLTNGRPIVVVQGRRATVTFFPDPLYNIPGNDIDVISLAGLFTATTCPAQLRSLSIQVQGTASSATGVQFPRAARRIGNKLMVLAGEGFSFNLTGVELNPTADRVLFVPLPYRCLNATLIAAGLQSPPTAPMPRATLVRNQLYTYWATVVGLRGSIGIAGSYRLCFQSGGGYVDVPGGTTVEVRAAIYQGVVVTTVDSPTAPFALTGTTASIPLGRRVTLWFGGRGLSPRSTTTATAADDSAKLVAVDSAVTGALLRPNCSSPAAYGTASLDHTFSSSSNASWTLTIQRAGRYLVCYRVRGTKYFTHVGTFNATAVISAVRPISFDGQVALSLTVHGAGLDTRSMQDAVRIVLPPPRIVNATGRDLCNHNPLVVVASLGAFSSPSDTNSMPPDPRLAMWYPNVNGYYVVRPLGPYSQTGLAAEVFNVSEGLYPGNYTVCHRHRGLDGTRMAWQALGTIVVRSTLTQWFLESAPADPAPKTGEVGVVAVVANETVSFLVEGVGVTLNAASQPLLRAVIGSSCDAINSGTAVPYDPAEPINSSSPISVAPNSFSLGFSDGLAKMLFPVMGRLVFCWTTPQRSLVYKPLRSSTGAAVLYVYPILSGIVQRNVGASAASLALNISGTGLDPALMRVFLRRGAGASCRSIANRTYAMLQNVTMNGNVAVATTATLAASASGRYTVCVTYFGVAASAGVINVSAAFSGLVTDIFEPNAPISLVLQGVGLNTLPIAQGGDRFFVVSGSGPSCDRSAAEVVVNSLLAYGPRGPNATKVGANLTALSPGNYTICYISFPSYAARAVAQFRVRSNLFNATIANAVASLSVDVVVAGADLSRRVSLRAILSTDNCSAPVDSSSWNATIVRYDYSQLVAQITFPVMGEYILCWMSTDASEWRQVNVSTGSGAGATLADSVFFVSPYINLTTPAPTQYASVSFVPRVYGGGLDPLALNATMSDSTGTCPTDWTVLSASAVTTFQGGDNTSLTGTLNFTLTGVGFYCYCLGLLSVTGRTQVWTGSCFNVTFTIVGLDSALLDPVLPLPWRLNISGFGFDSRPHSAGGDAAMVLPAANESTLANCANQNAAILAVSNLEPGDSTGLSALQVVVASALATGNYTLCLAGFPRLNVFVPVGNFRVMSAVTLVQSSQRRSAIGVAVEVYIKGQGLLFPFSAEPVIKALLSSTACNAADGFGNAPPSTAAPPIIPLATVSSPAGSTPAAPAPPPSNATPPLLPIHVAYPMDVTVLNSTTAVAHFQFPLIGDYRLCWSTFERGYVFAPLSMIWWVDTASVALTVSSVQADARPQDLVVSGTGLNPAVMNASVVASGSCNVPASTMTLHFQPDTYGAAANLNVTLLTAGTYTLCVGTLFSIVNAGPFSVVATVDLVNDMHVGQFDPKEVHITGAGLTLQDKVAVTRYGCSTLLTPLPLVTYQSGSVGLTETVFTLDTTTAGNLSLCYTPAGEASPRRLGTIVIDPEVKSVDRITKTYNPSGDRITLTVSGQGLNTTTAGDALRVIEGTDCTSNFADVWFAAPSLQPPGLFHQTTSATYWSNTSFPHHPYVELTVCYRFYGQTDYASIGTVVLPFANQAPSFSFIVPVPIIYSGGSDGVTKTVPFVQGVSPGYPPTEASQQLTFSLENNRTDIFTDILTIPSPISGVLQAVFRKKAVGLLSVTATLKDDGGTAYGGIDQTIQTSLLQVIYPYNTAPVVSIAAIVYVSQYGPVQKAVSNFILSATGGSNSWEAQQKLSYTVTLIDTNSYVQSIAMAANGSLLLSINVNATQYLGRSASVRAQVVVKDDGGIGPDGDEVDHTAPISFLIQIVVLNHAPVVDWVLTPTSEVIAVQNLAWVGTAARSVGIGPGDYGQQVDFQSTVMRIDALVNREPFSCSIAVANATGQMTILCDSSGNFSVTLWAHDNGGTALGGVDSSPPLTIALYVLKPFVLSVSPGSGYSFATPFTIQASGGLPNINARGIYMVLYLVQGPLLDPVSASNLVMVRSKGGLLFTTASLPAGTVTLAAAIVNWQNNTMQWPTVTITVGSMPRTVSYGSLAADTRSLIASGDIAGASFAILSVSVALGQSNSPDLIPNREEFLQVLLQLAQKESTTHSLGLLPESAVTQYGNSLYSLANANGRITIAAAPPEYDAASVKLSYSGLSTGIQVLDLLALKLDVTTATRATAQLLCSCAAVMLASVPQLQPITWHDLSDTSRTSGAYAQQRVAQNAVAVSLLSTAHDVLTMECGRMRTSQAQSAFVAIFPSFASFSADIATQSQQSLSGSFTTSQWGTATYTYGFDSTSVQSCASTISLNQPLTLVHSGSPAVLPWTFSYSVSVAVLSAGTTNSNTQVHVELNFGQQQQALPAGDQYLLGYSPLANDWTQVSFGRTPTGFLVSQADLAALRAQMPSSTNQLAVFAIGLRPDLAAVYNYVVIFLPVFVGIFLLHLIGSYLADGPMRRRRLTDPFFEWERLEPLTHVMQLFNNTLFFSPFVVNVSLRIFPRHQRVICLWASLAGPLLLMTAVQEIRRVTWAYEDSGALNLGRVAGFAVLMALVSMVVARIVWWLFTSEEKANYDSLISSAKGGAGTNSSVPMTTRDKKMILAWALFVLWTLTSMAYFGYYGSMFNAQNAVTLHWQGYLICVAFIFLWDLLFSALMVFALRSQVPRVAQRYIHPSIFSFSVPDYMMPFGIELPGARKSLEKLVVPLREERGLFSSLSPSPAPAGPPQAGTTDRAVAIPVPPLAAVDSRGEVHSHLPVGIAASPFHAGPGGRGAFRRPPKVRPQSNDDAEGESGDDFFSEVPQAARMAMQTKRDQRQREALADELNNFYVPPVLEVPSTSRGRGMNEKAPPSPTSQQVPVVPSPGLVAPPWSNDRASMDDDEDEASNDSFFSSVAMAATDAVIVAPSPTNDAHGFEGEEGEEGADSASWASESDTPHAYVGPSASLARSGAIRNATFGAVFNHPKTS